jgi:hypothetical protein
VDADACEGERSAGGPAARLRLATAVLSARDASSSLPAEGALVVLPDAPAAAVALLSRGSRVVHPGSVAILGPLAPPREAYLALGLSETEATALRFVASWFGAPLDAVNVRRRSDQPLSFGCWHLAGAPLAECLASWKRSAPAAFQELMASRGIDVTSEKPRLLVHSGSEELTGEEAADAVARDPQLVAVLARAGREGEGQLSQIDTVARLSLRPTLDILVPGEGGQTKLGALLRSPRSIALALHLELVFGLAGPEHLAKAIEAGVCPCGEDGEPRLAGFVGELVRLGCIAEAAQALRILASPELARV